MNEASPSFMMQLKTVFKHISAGKLMVLFGIVATTLGALVYLVMWAGQPDYEYLYTNLSAEDAGAIVAQLKERRIPYKIDAGGTAIAIPNRQIYEVRLDMASQGLPENSGIGFEIFDNTKLGMTEFIQNVNYQRALQGELSRTISRFQEVESARVHIVVPPKSLFVEEEEPSTASVVIKLKRGDSLNQNQVQSIVHLVSSSVARLETDHVTVVDSRGTLLAGFKKKSAADEISSDHLEFQRKVEMDLEDRVGSMLETVLGKNKAIVRVSCALDFRKEEQTEERYLPDNKVIRSERVKNETSNGADLIPVGIPGMASNVMPRATSTERPGGNSNFLRQDKTMNYEVGRVTRRQIMPVGAIQHMSVAVVVDGTYDVSKKTRGARNTTYIPRTAEEMTQIENLVKRAINFDSSRGDQVEVANIPFEEEVIEPVEMPETETGWTDHLATAGHMLKPVMVAVSVLAVFLFIIRPLMRWMTSTSPWDSEILQQLPKTVSELEYEYAGRSHPGGQPVSAMNEVNQLIAKDQDRSLELVQGWLNEANHSVS